MKKTKNESAFITWQISRSFLTSLISFVIGFLLAWLVWAQTSAYMLFIMRPYL